MVYASDLKSDALMDWGFESPPRHQYFGRREENNLIVCQTKHLSYEVISMKKWEKYSKEQLERIIQESFSFREVAEKIGYNPDGGSGIAAVKEIVKHYSFNTDHFTGQGWTAKSNRTIPSREKYKPEEILIQNSPVNQKVLRGYIERHQLLEYKCQNCGCDGNWQGGKIALEIHHMDGDNQNHTLSNLQYLCPNCHALTENYRGLNKGK